GQSEEIAVENSQSDNTIKCPVLNLQSSEGNIPLPNLQASDLVQQVETTQDESFEVVCNLPSLPIDTLLAPFNIINRLRKHTPITLQIEELVAPLVEKAKPGPKFGIISSLVGNKATWTPNVRLSFGDRETRWTKTRPKEIIQQEASRSLKALILSLNMLKRIDASEGLTCNGLNVSKDSVFSDVSESDDSEVLNKSSQEVIGLTKTIADIADTQQNGRILFSQPVRLFCFNKLKEWKRQGEGQIEIWELHGLYYIILHDRITGELIIHMRVDEKWRIDYMSNSSYSCRWTNINYAFCRKGILERIACSFREPSHAAEFVARALDGQKTANAAEWQKQNRINCDTIGSLKKDIKELTVKASRLRNPLQRPVVIKEPTGESRRAHSCTPTLIVGKATYPITESRKQMDLLRHRFKSRQQHFSKLVEKYRGLLANKEAQNQNLGEKPPETLEEDANRKLVCQLENEIHRTNVQWMEAEHIRKKYRSIEASLMTDAERFERSLRELEGSLSDQKAEIERLQQVHNEAVEMRDAAKRQEQQANLSQKTRERQALDFRKQVEARKLELERIGRKLFAETKTLVHQDSVGSSSGDQHTAKTENGEEEPVSQLESLMEASGATSPFEVFERFSAQKESAARLNYLRKAAEAEKANLEAEREALSSELEASKFSDVKESEVIAAKEQDSKLDTDEAGKSMGVLKYLKERICEMIFKVQEVDESNIEIPERKLHVSVAELPNFLTHTAEDEDMIEILKLKIKRCQELSKSEDVPPFEIPKLDIVDEEEEEEEMYKAEPPKSPSAPEGEKPQPMPVCYYNLFAGRAQRAAGTSSSSPEQAPAAGKFDISQPVYVLKPSRKNVVYSCHHRGRQ
ncbi:hypothetical protein M5D96_010489, partial [Drosophila gunungcola]